jgi:hypothetical protein
MDAMSNATEAKIACRSLKIHLGPNLGNAAGSDVATGATKSRWRSGGGNPLNNVNTRAGLVCRFRVRINTTCKPALASIIAGMVSATSGEENFQLNCRDAEIE